MFRTVPLSIIRSFSLYTQILLASRQQTCVTYTGVLISPQPDQKGKKLRVSKV